MEKLKRQVYLLSGIIFFGGVMAHIAAPASTSGHDEKWMEQNSLSHFGKYRMVQDDDGSSAVTYKMGKETYTELSPTGIVCREFTDGSNTFDVVLVASQTKDSFHDPRICFGAQGWNLDNESQADVSTSRGKLPLTVAQIRSGDSLRWSAFGYKGPAGFAGSTNRLKLDLFTYSLLHSKPGEGVFYRFIGLSPGIDRESLIKFIEEYMDASGKFSNGYF